MIEFIPTQYEKNIIEKWNNFTEKYCITIPTIARKYNYMNSMKINMFLQGKCALSSQTIGKIEAEITRIIQENN